MAIKQRLLMKLNNLESNLRYIMETGDKAVLNDVYQMMIDARDLCQDGLPEHSYQVYGEYYNGLVLAAQQMLEDVNTQKDLYLLCIDLLQYISQETKKEHHFKKELFFLPYNASMWDSLESVWKAACEDKEHCIPYVMPIPYASLTAEHTVEEWHCERALFPKYVSTLRWEDIDLRKWHPDVIIIHNPYDNLNFVTMVHSRYHSRNLQKCTDKLVYIPYAVEKEVQPGDVEMEDFIKQRVLQPGVLNAHLVIAQSEDTRQAWINILARHTNVKDRTYWENHILGLGSPKIDKVITSKREDFNMPENWKKLVRGKKIILYNTSLVPMLQHFDKVCDKLRYIFDIFRNRDDVLLWWRPHPLMKFTFHSIQPQYEEEYCQLEKEYIKEGWGIYDDTPDVHRAICWSDAYYGDESSVGVLYRYTQKPMMHQNFWVNNKQTGAYLWTVGNCIVDEETIWFVTATYNSLIQYDLVTKRIVNNILLTGCNFLQWTHYNLLKYDSYIILIPARDMNVFIYDTKERKLHRFPLKGEVDRKEKYMTYSVWKNFIYCFPLNRNDILRVDISALRVDSIRWDLAYKYLREKKDFVEHSATIGSKVFLLLGQSNKICEFDMEREQETVFSIGNDQAVYTNICRYGDSGLLLMERSGDIVILNEEKEIIVRKRMMENAEYPECIKWNEGYLLFDGNGTMIYWDEKSEEKIVLDIYDEKQHYFWPYAPYSRIGEGSRYIALFHIPTQELLVISKNDFTIKRFNILSNQFSEDFINALYRDEENRGLLQEDSVDGIALNRFIANLLLTKRKNEESLQCWSGMSIYTKICSEL